VSARGVRAPGGPPRLLEGERFSDPGVFKPEADGSNKAETAMTQHVPFRSVPLEIQDTDGNYKIFNMSGVPVFNERGRFTGYRGTSDDITARLLAEDEALASKSDLERAIQEVTKKNMQLEMTAKIGR